MGLLYKSTRSSRTATASEAILKGLSEDGGLFVPERIPALDRTPRELGQMSYAEVAYEVMKLFLADFTGHLEKKYGFSAYAQSNSFYAIRHVNYSAKVLGNLKYDANFYSRYMPLQDSVYSPNNIKIKSAALLEEIDKTIFEIGNAQ